MNETIWKFPMVPAEEQTIEMPVGARILCVQWQKGQPCLWAICNPSAAKENRTILTYGTGHTHESISTRKYIGTFQV
jgi:hypothetical protein